MNQGAILLRQSPESAAAEMNGKIWIKRIEGDLTEVQERYRFLSNSYNPDHSITVRIYSDEHPGEGFTSTIPNLEDVYFYHLNDGAPVTA